MLLMSLALINVGPATGSPGPVFLIVPSNTVADPGQSFTLNINVGNVPFTVRGWGLKIKFNTDVFEWPPVITEGPYLKSKGPTIFVTNPVYWAGYIAVSSVFSVPTVFRPPTGNGTLATITFKVKAPGASPLTLLNTELIKYVDASVVPADAVNGNFHTTVPVSAFDIWPKRYVYSAVHEATHVSEFEFMAPPTYPIACPYGDGANYTIVDQIQVYTPGVANKTMTFDASASWSPAGQNITTFSWDFDDGTKVTTNTSITTHAFAAYRRAPYQVKLNVTDSAGKWRVTTKSFLVWRDIMVADIWPSLVWFDTVDNEFFHGQINDGEIIYGSGEPMSYLEVLVTIVNQGSLTEKMDVSVTAKCRETGREYTLLFWDWLPSPADLPPSYEQYAMLRPGKGSGWNIDHYWHIAWPELRDAGTYDITATLSSVDYSVPSVSATGVDNDLTNNQMTYTVIVDAQADLSMKRIDNHKFSISKYGDSLGMYGKAQNKEKLTANIVGTWARVAFSIISPEGVPVANPKTDLVYLTNDQVSPELATAWTGLTENMAGVYSALAYVEFGPSPDKIIYTSITTKPFSIVIVP